MPLHVFLVVLAAAFLHAGWNTLLKLRNRPAGHGAAIDPMRSTLLLGVAASLIALLALSVTGLPSPRAWPYALASAVVHIAYYLLVGAAYRAADLSAVYPITRGSAPLGSALLAALLLGERLSPQSWAGVACIGLGVIGMATMALRHGGLTWTGFAFAAANAGIVMLYTLIDGQGARLSANPAGYTMLLEALCGPMLVPALVLTLRGPRRFGPTLAAALAEGRWWRALLGASMSIAAYAAALWAMTRAPIGAVAALREVSVLIGVLLGALVLRERVGLPRWIAAAVIVAGAMLVRLG
ncbi:MAG: EamA family transporter [Acetobacteraceae bacterium]|nr:EamA family transporter [Acetobacteraceae bacterium]